MRSSGQVELEVKWSIELAADDWIWFPLDVGDYDWPYSDEP